MLDLTKPIRNKRSKERVSVSVGYVRIDGDLYYAHLTREELEASYENVPEPRKPREWIAIAPGIDDYRPSGYFLQTMDSAAAYRMIEWPKGAPLPDWPEGY